MLNQELLEKIQKAMMLKKNCMLHFKYEELHHMLLLVEASDN
jgi:hypothetical protein